MPRSRILPFSHYQPVSLYTPVGDRKYVNLSERTALLARLGSLDRERRLFVLMLIWTGARVSEVLALSPSSFQLDTNVVAINTLKRRCRVVREIPIPGYLLDELDDAFSLRQNQPLRARAQEPLWKFHRVTAWRFIKDAMRRAGIDGVRASPRGLRHAFGVGTLAAGVPLNIVQRLLGHSSIATTTIYTEASGPEERAIVQKFWRADDAAKRI